MKAWVRVWAWAWVVVLASPSAALFTHRQRHQQHQEEEEEQIGVRQILQAINGVSQALETHERHTSLYERVALLETSLSEKTEQVILLQDEVTHLRAKIPELEAEIDTIPEMRKELAEFEANIEKLVQDYEVKLSTLASEVIRLKKSGARHKDLMTLSDGSNILLRPAPPCPEIGQGMVAERVGEHCLYFSFSLKQNWTESHNHCQQLGAEMAAAQVLQPLKQFLRHAFARGPSLWLGSSFNLSAEESHPHQDQTTRHSPTVHVKPSGGSSELTSGLPVGRELTGIFQADGLIDFPERDTQSHPLNLVSLNLKESSVEEAEESVGRAEGMDQVPSLRDELVARYRSRISAHDLPKNVAAVEVKKKSVPDKSIVDIVLLRDPGNEQEAERKIEQRLPLNQTDEGNRESASVMLDARTAALRKDEDMQEAVDTIQKMEKTKEFRKTGMRCMLLRQSESQVYEVVGRPCDEQHNFVCDFRVTIDTLLPEL